MRIVVNGWFWDQLATGSGQYLAALAAWLPVVDGGHEFVLVRHGKRRTQINEPAKALPPLPSAAASASDWTIIDFPTPFDFISANLAKVWFEQITFPGVCRSLQASVALVPYWGSPWWRPCPVAVTIHDLIPLLLPAYRGEKAQRLYAWLVTHTARRAAVVLTDSEAGRRDIMAHLGIPAERVHTIHLAAGPEYRRVENGEELERVRARYNLPVDPYFIYLGGFDARKNVVRVIEAYGRLVASASPPESLPKLVLAGRLPASDSAFAPDPRPVVARLGLDRHVHLTGWVDEADKPALYSLACAALFPSDYEGFGLPVIEAQACGCPVITSER
jgi:glycosyltransferase involved in cell wall biosynthesis